MATPVVHTSLIQRTDYLIASAMVLTSVMLLFSAALTLGAPKTASESLLTRAHSEAQSQCISALQSYNVPFNREGASLRVAESTARPLASLIERTSLIQQSCPGYVVSSACVGASCSDGSGIHLTLQPSLVKD